MNLLITNSYYVDKCITITFSWRQSLQWLCQ